MFQPTISLINFLCARIWVKNPIISYTRNSLTQSFNKPQFEAKVYDSKTLCANYLYNANLNIASARTSLFTYKKPLRVKKLFASTTPTTPGTSFNFDKIASPHCLLIAPKPAPPTNKTRHINYVNQASNGCLNTIVSTLSGPVETISMGVAINSSRRAI